MATKLFLRTGVTNAIGTFRDMLTTAGDVGSDTAVVNTAASGTEIQWTHTAGGAVAEWISGRAPAGGFTLSGTMTFSIWANESNMNANCGARARVFKRTAAGVESEVAGGPWNDGVEFGTAAAEMVWTGTPTSTAFAENDRLIVRYYITNVGTMAGGYTCTLTYSGPDATTGDSFFQINETVAFKAEDVPSITGTAAPSLSSLAATSAVKVIVEASAAPGLGSLTTVSAATVSDPSITATAAPALGAFLAASAAKALVEGIGSGTLNAFSSVGVIGTRVGADAALALDAFTSQGAAAIRVDATAAPALSAFSTVATATVVSNTRTLSGNPALGTFTTASEAKARVDAAGLAELAAFATVAPAVVRVKASAGPALGSFGSVGTATVVGGSRTIAGAPALDAFGSTGAGLVRVKAVAVAVLADFSAASAAGEVVSVPLARTTVAEPWRGGTAASNAPQTTAAQDAGWTSYAPPRT